MDWAQWFGAIASGLLIAGLGWLWRLSAILERLKQENRDLRKSLETQARETKAQMGIRQLQTTYKLEVLESVVDGMEKFLESNYNYQRRQRPRMPQYGEQTGANFINRSSESSNF